MDFITIYKKLFSDISDVAQSLTHSVHRNLTEIFLFSKSCKQKPEKKRYTWKWCFQFFSGWFSANLPLFSVSAVAARLPKNVWLKTRHRMVAPILVSPVYYRNPPRGCPRDFFLSPFKQPAKLSHPPPFVYRWVEGPGDFPPQAKKEFRGMRGRANEGVAR